MLASLAALHLLLAAPRAAPPADGTEGALAQATAPEAQPGDATPPGEAAPPAAEAPAAEAPAPARRAPAARPAAPRPPGRRPFASLQGADALGGASALFAWAGWSSLGAAWAMGVTSEDDAGVFADHDWSKSELRLGGLYRRPIATAGAFDVGLRLSLAYYANLGSTYVYTDNHSERGVEVGPAVVFSERTSGGLFAVSVEGPLTVTTKYRTGLLFAPRVGLSYEAELYPQLTVGARAGAGYRAGAGDAPLKEGRGELQFLVLLGYQLL